MSDLVKRIDEWQARQETYDPEPWDLLCYARDEIERTRFLYAALRRAVRTFLDEPAGETSRDEALGLMDLLTRGSDEDLVEVTLDDLD